jgi:hypothetical protein
MSVESLLTQDYATTLASQQSSRANIGLGETFISMTFVDVFQEILVKAVAFDAMARS